MGMPAPRPSDILAVPEELVRSRTDVSHDLAEENRGDVATAMDWYRCSTPVRVAKLLVGAPLPDFLETHRL